MKKHGKTSVRVAEECQYQSVRNLSRYLIVMPGLMRCLLEEKKKRKKDAEMLLPTVPKS
jgi:hypothetical protein